MRKVLVSTLKVMALLVLIAIVWGLVDFHSAKGIASCDLAPSISPNAENEIILQSCWWYAKQESQAYGGPAERIGNGMVIGKVIMLEMIQGQAFALIQTSIPGYVVSSLPAGTDSYLTEVKKSEDNYTSVYVALPSLWSYPWPDGMQVLVNSHDLGEFRSGKVLMYRPADVDPAKWPGLEWPDK